jgi:hypothetical protein
VKTNFWAATACIMLAATVPGHAQDQLELTLDAYVAQIKASGGTFDFSAKNVGSDGSVEYRDLKMGDGTGGFAIDAQWLRATPAGDAVTITWAPTVQVSFAGEGGTDSGTVTVTSENFALTTNAIVPDPTVLEVVDVKLSADSLKVGDLTGTNPVLSALDIAQTGLEVSFNYDGPGQKATGSWKAAIIDGVYGFAMDGMESSSDTVINDFALSFGFDIPVGEQDIAAFLTGDKDFSARFETSSSTGSGTSAQDGMAFAYESTGGPSSAVVEIVDGLLTYSVKGVDATILLTPEGMPMPPVNLSMREVGMEIIVPFSAADAPALATIGLKFGDVAVGEELWAMIDPMQSIPRDPLNIDVNLTSNMLFPGDFAAAVAGEVGDPFALVKVSDVNINSFLVSVAGASVTAAGALTINNDGPFPMPSGTVNVEVNGAQGLAEKLVALGLIDQMQSGMALGMIMSFAKPGSAPDQFVSEIEVMEDGTILANGMPLPM